VLAAVPVVLWTVLLLTVDKTFWSLVYDDSFYYWQIGSNIAAGRGSTFDGIHLTNGYHPLWMLFSAGLYALGLGRDAAPLVALVVQVVLFGLAWWLLGRSVLRLLREVPGAASRRVENGALALLLAVACIQPLLKVWVNGLESTFVLLCQVALLGVLLRSRDLLAPAARGDRWAVAVLLAATFGSRTDGALLLPAIGLWLLPRLVRRFRETVVPTLELLVLPSLLVIGYLVANQAWFGSAVQVSGLLKSPEPSVWRALAAAAVVGLPVWLARRFRSSRWPRLGLVLVRTRPFGLFCLFLVAYYGVLQTFPRAWYFGPVLLYVVLLGCAGIADLLDLAVAEAPSGRLPTRLVVVLGLCAVVPIGFGLWQAVTAPAATPMLTGRAAARAIASDLPQDAVLASWDAGVFGYYCERPVVNLDGVVNSAGFLAAVRSGTTAEYLADVPIGWVVNHSPDEATLRTEAHDVLGDRVDGATVVRTWPFEVFAGSNQVLPQAQKLAVYLLQLARP